MTYFVLKLGKLQKSQFEIFWIDPPSGLLADKHPSPLLTLCLQGTPLFDLICYTALFGIHTRYISILNNINLNCLIFYMNLPDEILNHIHEYIRIIHNKNTRNLLIRSKIEQLELRTKEEWIRMIVSFPERYEMIAVKECNTILKIQWSPKYYFIHKQYSIYKKDSILNRYFIHHIIYKHFDCANDCVGVRVSKCDAYYQRLRDRHHEMCTKKLKELENQKMRELENQKWIEKYGYLHYISLFLFGYTIANIININIYL